MTTTDPAAGAQPPEAGKIEERPEKKRNWSIWIGGALAVAAAGLLIEEVRYVDVR